VRVGLEAGLQRVNQHWFNAGWVVVVDPTGVEGVASTLRMAVPETLMRLVREGRELGQACDLAIDRTGAFADAVIAALAPVPFLSKRRWERGREW
jgi:non-canonical (house-cleaning) NTP pyrophosphatase